jgi:hypothetical protein
MNRDWMSTIMERSKYLPLTGQRFLGLSAVIAATQTMPGRSGGAYLFLPVTRAG